jgi:hypothetical protein
MAAAFMVRLDGNGNAMTRLPHPPMIDRPMNGEIFLTFLLPTLSKVANVS